MLDYTEYNKKTKNFHSLCIWPRNFKQNTNTNTPIFYVRVMKLQSKRKQWLQIETVKIYRLILFCCSKQ